jgi:predicted secreted protein
MAATAGYGTKVYISTDGGSTYTEITGIKSVAGAFGADDLDTSAFSTGQWRTHVQGLKMVEPKLDGFWDTGTAQAAIRAAFTSGATVRVRVFWDGSTNGYTCDVKVMGFEVSPAVDTLIPVSYDLKSTAAPTFLP